MTPDDRESHEAKAEEVERELDDLQEQSERLQGDIQDTGEDWERKKKDASVPGAAGQPDEAEGTGPETDYPAKSDEGEEDGSGEDASAEDLDFGRDEDVDLAPQGSRDDESDDEESGDDEPDDDERD